MVIVGFVLTVVDLDCDGGNDGVTEYDGGFDGYVGNGVGQVTFEGVEDGGVELVVGEWVEVMVGQVTRMILGGAVGEGFVGAVVAVAVVDVGGGTVVGVVVAAGIGGVVAVAGGVLGMGCCCWCLCEW